MEFNRNLPLFLKDAVRAPNRNTPFLKYAKASLGRTRVPQTQLLSKANSHSIRESIRIKSRAAPDQRSLKIALSVINLIDDEQYTKTFLIKKPVKINREIIFQKRSSLNQIISKLRTSLANIDSEIIQSNLQRLEALTIYSKEKNTIVLSGDPWDIATMSMRGIKSCMNWRSPHRFHLKGSIIDPATYVCYITDGVETPLGTKMLYRAVVRLINKSGMSRPAYTDNNLHENFYVYIDKLYTTTGNLLLPNVREEVINIMTDFLNKQIKDIPNIHQSVINMQCGDAYKYVILSCPEVEALDTSARSCVDSGIPYIKVTDRGYRYI